MDGRGAESADGLAAAARAGVPLRATVAAMLDVAPPLSVPIVWADLVCPDRDAVLELTTTVLGWKPLETPGSTDAVIYLDQARSAGPVCAVRGRTPSDPQPEGLAIPEATLDPSTPEPSATPVPERWAVRLSPPKPPQAVDPGGDQLLRPRAPGPRFARWGVQHALCFFELRTPEPAEAARWMERRLDAVVRPATDADAGGASGVAPAGALIVESSFQPGTPVAVILPEPDPALAGWLGVVQVGDLPRAVELAKGAGASCTERPVPAGLDATAAVHLTLPAGGGMVLAARGVFQGRRG